MTIYRIDRYETNEHDPLQQLGYADWMGGPTLSNVRGAIVAGTAERRSARVTGEADTWFSVPAQVKLKGRTIKGWLGSEDGIYYFHPYKGA